jgi:hypothetical protein
LKRIEIEEELRIVKREGVLTNQPVAIRSSPHSSSSSKCVERKAYNEKIKLQNLKLSFCAKAKNTGVQKSKKD